MVDIGFNVSPGNYIRNIVLEVDYILIIVKVAFYLNHVICRKLLMMEGRLVLRSENAPLSWGPSFQGTYRAPREGPK